MSRTVIFDPLVPLPLIWALAALAVVMLAFAIWRGLRRWPLRGLAMLALGLALVNPSLQEENRKPLSDIILAVVDDSASQRLAVAPGREAEGIFHMPGGQSAHPLSPFFRAGHDAWVRGEAAPLLPGPAMHRLTLRP